MGAALWELRNRLKTSLTDATSGGGSPLVLTAARIVLGYDVQAEDNTFLSGLVAAGPYLLIKPGALVAHLSASTRLYRVPMRLYVAIVQGTDNDFTLIEKLLANMRSALVGDELTWDVPEIDALKSPALVKYELSVDVKGC